MKTKKKGKRQIQPVEAIPVVTKPIYLALSFIFPVFILGTVFALHGVYPFGNRQILLHDFGQQFFPFLSNFWHKLREGSPGLPGSPSLLGGVSPWSWTAGGGHDYVALIAYYLASPLNLLTVLAPHAWLRESITLVLLMKIGFAGLFMGVYLRYTFRQGGQARHIGLALPVFSSLYALCAFTLGYYWNVLWFDSFALFPLVMLGFSALLNEGKYRLYIVSLALAVFTNYYIGFYICIFVVITFVNHSIIHRFTRRDFLRKLGLTAACSVLAVGMTAVLMLPTLSALRNTPAAADRAFPNELVLYHNFFDVLGNFIAFTPPTFVEGLPNLYCGMISVLLLGLYFRSPKISRREKTVFAVTVVFLLVSCNFNIFYYIMNGFNIPNMVPFRFSFLISFILVVTAYRVFIMTDIDRRSLQAVGISAAVFLLAAFFGFQGWSYLIGSAVLCVLYLLLLYFTGRSSGKARQIVMTALLLVIVTELSITSDISVKTTELPGRDGYPDRYEQIQELLDMPRSDDVDFYRTDIDIPYTNNDPPLYNYNGLSFFSSTVDDGVVKFIRYLGLQSGGAANNFVMYNKTSPLINTFLNMRYMITRENYSVDDDIYWEIAGRAGDSLLLKNKCYLPLGFMVNGNITGYRHNNDNLFLSQNDLFRRATGIDADLFKITDLSKDTPGQIEGPLTARWYYEIPSDGMLYAYYRNDMYSDLVVVYLNGVYLKHFDVYNTVPFLTIVGKFAQGDNLSFMSAAAAYDTSIILGFLNSEIFEQGYALLADETLHLTKFTDTQVIGDVTALSDGVLYTSIPGKNWNVFVDGVKSKLLLIDNAMAAVRVKEGTHTVEFRYYNKSLTAGIIISLVSLAVFIMLILLKMRKSGNNVPPLKHQMNRIPVDKRQQA